MLDPAVLLLVILNFGYIGLLPLLFFKREGRLNLAWWLTALPLFITPAFLLAAYYGFAELPMIVAMLEDWNLAARLAAVPITLLSVSLISLTIGTHRIPIALWHQKDDAPSSIVTWGAYGRLRHPFYTSFILAQLGALLLHPHPVTLATLVMTGTCLAVTAIREERRLCGSEFGNEYQAYMQRTGRFIPRLRVRKS